MAITLEFLTRQHKFKSTWKWSSNNKAKQLISLIANYLLSQNVFSSLLSITYMVQHGVMFNFPMQVFCCAVRAGPGKTVVYKGKTINHNYWEDCHKGS
jgi:hypothetical protein